MTAWPDSWVTASLGQRVTGWPDSWVTASLGQWVTGWPDWGSGEAAAVGLNGYDSGPAVGLVDAVASTIDVERSAVGEGNVAVIVPDSLHASVREGLTERGVDFAGPGRNGLCMQVTLVPVRLVKGLEVDAAISSGTGSRRERRTLRCTGTLRMPNPGHQEDCRRTR